MASEILVSIYMTTYYHEKYIAAALDSILKQKVDFDYEIIVSDDCSKDNTVEIIKEYAKKHSCIKLNVNETNLGLTKNMYLAKMLCIGKYITTLSGDDYWIDDYKLQKQVDFLNKHREYASVATVVEGRYDEDNIPFEKYPKKKLIGKRFTLDMFLAGENLPLNGIMIRNFFSNNSGVDYSIMPRISSYIDDVTDSILYLMEGDSFVLPDASIAYRVRRKTKQDHNYNSINQGLLSYERHIEMLNNLDRYFQGRVDLCTRYSIVIGTGIKKLIQTKQIERFIRVYKTIPKCYRKRYLFVKSLDKFFIEILNVVRRRCSGIYLDVLKENKLCK